MEPTMPSYTAEFRTDVDFANRVFRARSPQDALKKARAFATNQIDELSFEHYSGAHPVNEIAVSDAAGDEAALWQDEDLRLRLAAGDLFDALELCVDCLADLARLDDGTPSVSALGRARAAIARVKTGQP
jgi:hypothetical protein